MKLFGWKTPRDGARPALSTSAGAWTAGGGWPQSYEAQVREGYGRNPIAQRAVRLVAEAVGDAPLIASDPALAALATARSGGQVLIGEAAAHLLLHGNTYALRGGDPATVIAKIDAILPRAAKPAPGDLLLMATGPGQLHLGVRVAGGFVHADAGLRRVVRRPGEPPWPLLGAWAT